MNEETQAKSPIYINSEAGNDSGDGSKESPLRSYEEFERRVKAGKIPAGSPVVIQGRLQIGGKTIGKKQPPANRASRRAAEKKQKRAAKR